MNTVFKFYYQAWIMMAVGSAYALHYINTRGGTAVRVVGQVIVAILVIGCLVYPVFAIPSKANDFQNTPSLDGAGFVAAYRPDEAAVIDWLRTNTSPDAIIVEAPGGSYTDDNTISAHSGRATLMGWTGHELQWRGTSDFSTEREPAIEVVYINKEPGRIKDIVDTYDITYLIVGPRELSKYGIPPSRQNAYLELWEPAFEQGDYTVYRWRSG